MSDRKTSSQVILSSILFMCFTFGACSRGSFLDPFASSPKGQKIFLAPALVNQMPLTDSTDQSHPRLVLFRIVNQNFPPTSNQQPSTASSPQTRVSSIALQNKYGQSTALSWSEIITASKSDQCKSKSNDVQILTSTYHDLTVICDKDFSDKIPETKLITIKTEDGVEHTVTSWGINRSEFGGSEFLDMYTLSI